MSDSERSLVNLPTSVVLRRLDQEDAKILKRSANTPLDEFIQKNERQGDWIIVEQPVRTLPRALTEFLSLSLRDEGDALIEETRAINNSHVGRSMQSVRASLFADMEVVDLRARVLDWTERVTREVLYKCRRRIKDDALGTYAKLFDSIVYHVDNVIVHRPDRLYQFAWTAAIDCMTYILFEGCFLSTGKIEMVHTNDVRHDFLWRSALFYRQDQQQFLGEQINLFGIEPAQYAKEIILQPLKDALEDAAALAPPDQLRREFHEMLGGLLEAFPYLVASDRAARYTFAIPNTSCMAAFSFLGSHGFAMFRFFDSHEDLLCGVETNNCRAGLSVDFDGTLGCLMHPWLTLDRILGSEASALRVAHWFLSQLHQQVVEDYLKINRYFIGGAARAPEGVEAPQSVFDENMGAYTEWAREARELDDNEVVGEVSRDSSATTRPKVPQIRRSRFFRILQACGVEIAQGKGSELKLLRGTAHPFRLGSHYGPNPTVPTFLAAQILKRLAITHEEWRSAVEATRS